MSWLKLIFSSYFDNWWIVWVIFQAGSTISLDLKKINKIMSGFWTVGWKKEAIRDM